MLPNSMKRSFFVLIVAVCFIAVFSSCGKKEMQYETNLLENPSFEKVKDGIPEHWELALFRGLEGQQEVQYGIDNETAADRQNSWFFRGDPGTRLWYVLTQEVEVVDVSHVRLRGWMKLDQVERRKDQYSQCNFLLTFFDKDHNRFQVMRFADKRTRLKVGTTLWFEEDNVFRVPKGTRYIAVSCILGMDGTAWFDNVSLTVPQPSDWQAQETKNYVFHWLRERPFPPGAMQNQQKMFDQFSSRLGVESDVVVQYYLYPDTASIRKILSIKGHQYISWDDQEYHSIDPNDNHEVVHFITDPYGTPPRSIAEGTVFWLQGAWQGQPIQRLAAVHLANMKLPSVMDLTNYNSFAMIDPNYSIPAAASFVGFIVEKWGVDRFMALHRAVNGADNYSAFSRGFEIVYGVPCSDAENQWRSALRKVKIDE